VQYLALIWDWAMHCSVFQGDHPHKLGYDLFTPLLEAKAGLVGPA
jgi:hypothetical protein